MSFANFYLVGGGAGSADFNAGSSIGAVQATTTNGSWNSGTGVFIASGGTPFASTTTSDYASIYVDGSAVTTYVAKVKTVTSSTQITVDTTVAYGTAPTTNGTLRSCSINGSWNSEQVLAAGGLATFTVPQSTKINVTGNLTITASRTISMAGSATAPLWVDGYHANPGDLDADTTNSLSKPVWTLNATFALTTSGAQMMVSNLSVVGARSGLVWNASGAAQTLTRVRIENTSSNAAAIALQLSTNQVGVFESWMKCPTTATTSGVVLLSAVTATLIGCVIEGGGIAGVNAAANRSNYVECVFLSNTGAGILATTALMTIVNCTFYGATVDGVKWSGTPSATSYIAGCLFSGLNGSTATTNGINNASGTNTTNIYRSCNDYYNVTNPEVGLGDAFAFFPQTDSNPVVTSATDMTPVTGSNALAHGFPGIFENETFSSYANIGAVQQIAGAGFTGGIFGG